MNGPHNKTLQPTSGGQRLRFFCELALAPLAVER